MSLTAAAEPQTHSAFEWKNAHKIDSLNIVVEEYEHRQTGAQHLHIAADNTENVFLVAFRTTPFDDTGVAHILEHTSLCGSQQYPVRDPFFMMIRRSLNTFMNAFTSSDWTAYPFASQNKKDFQNLLAVYLDAVFFSRLDPLDFAQEGHRVEFSEVDNLAQDLVYKGVVYNEMKGAMSSPTSTLWQMLTHHVFPTNTYHYNSGGDPKSIPDLTHAQLLRFYKTHYHPSNAVFMTFGDLTAKALQTQFEALALSRFERLDQTIQVADERRYEAPISVTEQYALDDNTEDKTHIVMAWLLGHGTDLDALLEAHLLSSLLLDNSASPLLQALETTDLGAAPSPMCGLEDSNKEMSFMCGLEGSDPKHTDALRALVLGVLEKIAQDGLPQERVDAMLHQLELSQREIGGGGYPYGLQLILSALPGAIHRGDPVGLLDIEPALDILRKKVKDPQFVPRLVKSCLLDNPHCVTLTLVPDTELSAQVQQQEMAKLSAMKEAMSATEKQSVIDLAKRLKARQEEEDNPEILPKVGLEDVPDEVSIATGSESSQGFHYYTQGTNGLVYQQIVVDLPDLSPELQRLLPYFNACFTELGVGDKDYLSMQEEQSSVSGGIHASVSTRGAIDDVQNVTGYFVLSGKALQRNHVALGNLLKDTLEHIRFDEVAHIYELISQIRARREQSITDSGHTLAMLAATSRLSPIGYLSHHQRGLAGIKSLITWNKLLSDEGEMGTLVEQFKTIHAALLAAPKQFLLVGEAEYRETYVQALTQNWAEESSVAIQPFSMSPMREHTQQLWITSTQVNFCAKAYATVSVAHPDAAPLAVLGGFLRNGFLHRSIREQGGAYGGGASNDSGTATFRFYSYRDPRLQDTLADFDRSVAWLLTEKHEWRQLEEAILGVISQIDKPGSPAGEAQQAFHENLFGRTSEQRQAARKRILEVTIEDLQRVGQLYLTSEQASVAVITNQTTFEEMGDLGMEVFHLA